MWCQSEPHTGAGLKFKTFRCSPLTCKTQAKVIGGTTPCYQVFMRVMQQSNVQHARFSARWGNFTTQKLPTLNGISLEHCRPHSQQELCVPYNRPQGRFQCLLQSILSVPAQHKQTKAELGVPRTTLGRDQRMPVLLLQAQQKGVQGQISLCGKQSLQQRGFQPEHLGWAATE